MIFLDSHLHLQNKRIMPRSAEIVSKAVKRGVVKMICNATSERDWQDVLDLAKEHNAVYPFLGIHPWYGDTVEKKWLDRLTTTVQKNSVGIGEIGLDRVCKTDFLQQEKIFLAQLELARQQRCPVAIHCVKAWGRLVEILSDFQSHIPAIMIHGFAGSRETMERLTRMGIFISFSTQLAHPARKKLRDVFLQTPLDRILLETDSPNQFCAELAKLSAAEKQTALMKKTKVNEPAVIPALYHYGAALRGIKLDDFTKSLWKNGKIFTN
ncbi:MAG: TatD family hydrolase [Desulfobulbaceae bacterium]|nr:TatD family hydrolase [Desulfobulbaceae bacterium]